MLTKHKPTEVLFCILERPWHFRALGQKSVTTAVPRLITGSSRTVSWRSWWPTKNAWGSIAKTYRYFPLLLFLYIFPDARNLKLRNFLEPKTASLCWMGLTGFSLINLSTHCLNSWKHSISTNRCSKESHSFTICCKKNTFLEFLLNLPPATFIFCPVFLFDWNQWVNSLFSLSMPFTALQNFVMFPLSSLFQAKKTYSAYLFLIL